MLAGICASLKRSATALGFKSACAEPNIQIVGFAYVKTTFTLLYVTVRIDQNPENPEAFQAFIHALERDHPRARMIVLSALGGQAVTSP